MYCDTPVFGVFEQLCLPIVHHPYSQPLRTSIELAIKGSFLAVDVDEVISTITVFKLEGAEAGEDSHLILVQGL